MSKYPIDAFWHITGHCVCSLTKQNHFIEKNCQEGQGGLKWTRKTASFCIYFILSIYFIFERHRINCQETKRQTKQISLGKQRQICFKEKMLPFWEQMKKRSATVRHLWSSSTDCLVRKKTHHPRAREMLCIGDLEMDLVS